MEFALFLAVLCVVTGLFAARRDRSSAVIGAAAIAMGAGAWSFSSALPTAVGRTGLPSPIEDEAFVSSDRCRACHPSQYASWHDSFHRTMTQAATADSVLANWEGITLEDRGFTTKLSRRGEAFWAELADPLWHQDSSPERPPQPPTIEAQIVMTTGSHHLQNYWIRRPSNGVAYLNSFDNGALVQLPWVWMVEEARWSPVQDSFLTPPSPHLEPLAVWNTSCHLCHSVAPEPRFDGENFSTRAAELGVACEACHGPGEEHVRVNRSPLRRYGRWLSGAEGDPTIVNPARLDPIRSTEVCGQCHSFTRVVDIPGWQQEGVPFRPGDRLEDSKALLLHEETPENPHLIAQLAEEPNALIGRYWKDGTIRVAGREYNGLAESGCFQRGDLTCLSCHSLHEYTTRNDQLSARHAEDASCLQCHDSFRENPSAHTHHEVNSSGSQCQNCHMPHTTYGLFVAMRSHRIDSPSAAISQKTGRPNACNLCHLDQSLAWTDGHMSDWYGHETSDLRGDDQSVAASVRWLLEGDAAQRAITAWHMGWPPAQEASGKGWQAAHLAVLLTDPYASIRRVAQRSIETLPGFDSFSYDHLASAEDLVAARGEAWSRWQKSAPRHLDRRGSSLLLDGNANIDFSALSRRLKARDNTPLRIIE